MGSPIVVELAEIRVADVENTALATYKDPPNTYRHFVDDGIADFRDKSRNSLTDDLQCNTIEYPSHDGSLPYNSCAPSSSKDSVIRSLTRRAHILCSPNTYKKNWTQSTQPPYKMDTPLTESNASWTVSNKN